MPAPRELKRRIRSVQSTRQITKALELVSGAKMRRASKKTLANRPYAERLWKMATDILSHNQEGVSHPLMTAQSGNRTLLIAIASDRGSAGAYNTNISRAASAFMASEQAAGRTVDSIVIGKKLDTSFHKLGLPILQHYPYTGHQLEFEELGALYRFALQGFLNHRFDQVHLIYTRFTSALTQEVISEKLLPLTQPDSSLPTSASSELLYEPSPAYVLNELLPYIVEVQLYQATREATASEHAARRLAMHNASENAKSMIEKLNLTYNSLRQSIITQEIAEITSGAAAVDTD